MRKISILVSGFLAALSVSAAAQTVPVPGAVLALPPAHKVPAPAPLLQENLALPEKAGAAITFTSVDITGAKVISQSEIAKQFAGLAGKTASAAQLRAALDGVDALYTQAGYALGRAYIPAQQMKDGVLTIKVLEGYVGAVVVTTDTPRVKDTIARYAGRLMASRPLRSADLDRELRLMSDIPGVTIAAKLTDMNPDTGAVALVLNVTYQPIVPSLALDSRSNVRGLPVQPYLTLKANDWIGTGDQFTLTALLSPIPKDEYYLQAGASTAIGSDGWRVASTTFIAKARANILPTTIDLSSTQLRSDLQASYPLVKSNAEQLTATGGSYFSRLNYSLNQSMIARDRQMSFYTDLSDYRQFSPRLSLSLAGRVTAGFSLPYVPAIAGSRANATRDYAKLAGAGALSYAWNDHYSVLLRADGQVATGSLTASEEVSYGADRFGRGYDSGIVSGDHGFGLSVQPQYAFTLMPGWGAAAYVFGDYAQVYNTRGDGQRNVSLASTGIGFNVSYDIYTAGLGLAEPLEKIPGYVMPSGPRLFGTLQVKL